MHAASDRWKDPGRASPYVLEEAKTLFVKKKIAGLLLSLSGTIEHIENDARMSREGSKYPHHTGNHIAQQNAGVSVGLQRNYEWRLEYTHANISVKATIWVICAWVCTKSTSERDAPLKRWVRNCGMCTHSHDVRREAVRGFGASKLSKQGQASVVLTIAGVFAIRIVHVRRKRKVGRRKDALSLIGTQETIVFSIRDGLHPWHLLCTYDEYVQSWHHRQEQGRCQ